jgi:hypothetical protein
MFNLEKAHILIDEMVVNGCPPSPIAHPAQRLTHPSTGCITESSQAEVLDQLSLIDLEVSRGK